MSKKYFTYNSSSQPDSPPTSHPHPNIRFPAVAGSFYPEDPHFLKSEIDQDLDQASLTDISGQLKILIVPHAGIDFSGSVAGAGFKQIEGKNYSHIFLLGISHQVIFDYAAIYPEGSWETPLSQVSIDQDLAQKIIDKEKGILPDKGPHLPEHSLEMELIFLQRVLKDFKIVPVLLGQVSEDLLKTLAEKITPLLNKETLLVISSDLSHYPVWEVAKHVDEETIKSILSGKEEIFLKTQEEISQQNFSNLETTACAALAIRIGMKIAAGLDLNFKKIAYENSGDVTGEKRRVVGYGAIGAWQNSSDPNPDLELEKEVLSLARQTLEDHLSGRPVLPKSLITFKSPFLLEPLGAFVTLKKDGQLRGCIGEFEPKEPLFEMIQKMAIAAATQDPRFPKVLLEELKEIKIEVSVMSPRKKINNWQEVKLGEDGVVIQYKNHAGTFLPQVAEETSWSLEEFLSQLCCQKAGLPPHAYKNSEVDLYTFQVQIFSE
ncbi:MAG: AmmeMemoRadiSam system protein B [Patescibacteria group bacterium]|nr:AmmeMemoRadiSam system protein B [Patescibacteria group bacterium]